MFWSFPQYRLSSFLLRFKMSAQQTNKDKPRSSKCRHFCFAFDAHNYCPTCRESGKSDDPCVTFDAPCQICVSFTEEQLIKISLLIWTYPLRDLELPHMSRKWKWTMVLHFLHVSVLTFITHRIRILMHPRSLLRSVG